MNPSCNFVKTLMLFCDYDPYLFLGRGSNALLWISSSRLFVSTRLLSQTCDNDLWWSFRQKSAKKEKWETLVGVWQSVRRRKRRRGSSVVRLLLPWPGRPVRALEETRTTSGLSGANSNMKTQLWSESVVRAGEEEGGGREEGKVFLCKAERKL